jgi:hypothetical protein
MKAIQKLLADTATKVAEHENVAKANTAELIEARNRRLKAGLESEQAKARMMTHAADGKSIKLIQQEPVDLEMEDARGKRAREESGEEQAPMAKRGSSPAIGEQEEQKAVNEEPSDAHQADKDKDNLDLDMMEEVEESL